MNLDVEIPIADSLDYNSLMGLVDFSNRWIYKGSLTTPPCHRYVVWNVVNHILPIREDQVALIRNRL